MLWTPGYWDWGGEAFVFHPYWGPMGLLRRRELRLSATMATASTAALGGRALRLPSVINVNSRWFAIPSTASVSPKPPARWFWAAYGATMDFRPAYGVFNTESVLKTKRIAWPAYGVFAQQMLSLATT
jgi:WXXGXW repeat (2 copies)